MKETRQIEVDGRMVFDHRVEIRDPKTGKIEKYQPYILHINREGQLYECPPKSGKFFDTTGVLVKDVSKEIQAKQEAAAKAAETVQAPADPVQTPAETASPTKTEEPAPAAVSSDPVASAEAEADAILSGARNRVSKRAVG